MCVFASQYFKKSAHTALFFYGLMVFLSFSVLNFCRIQAPQIFAEREERLISPLRQGRLFTFGFHELRADFLWLNFIQHLDFCRDQKDSCELGWGYQMLLEIHDLAPRFRIPMAVGPMSLSVLNNDVKGADLLHRQAIESFPKDWPILYRAAYHFMADGQDPALAADLLIRAQKSGGPPWLSSLAARLFEREGQRDLALQALREYRKSLSDPQLIQKVDARIEKAKSLITAP